MNLEPYVETIRRQLEVAAEGGGDEARALAARLAAQLDAAIRLAIQDALAAAADEITVDMAPGSVELRLRGREPEFVVSLPPLDPSDEDGTGSEEGLAGGWRTGVPGPRGGADPDEPPVARINLRLPDRVKSRVEESAAADGLSVNSWLVRAAAAALERRDPVRRRERNTPHGAQRYTGWSR